MRGPLVTLALGVLVLGGCATAVRSLPVQRCPLEGGPAWRTLTSEHFVVHTNLDSAAAHAETQRLEQLRRALLLPFGPAFDPPGRIEVYLVGSAQEWRELMGDRVGGFFVALGSPRIFMPANERGHVYAHELTHHLHAFVHPGAPRWLREGLAQYLETLTLDGSARQAGLGRANRDAMGWLRIQPAARLSWLWEAQDRSLEADELALFYASSWAWVHFLLNERPREFADFQRRLAATEEPRGAFAAAFGVKDMDTLYSGLQGYLRLGRYSYVSFPLPPAPTGIQEEELGPADAHAHYAHLRRFGMAGAWAQRKAAAEAEVARGLAHDPRHLGLRVAQAPMPSEDRGGALAAARRLTREAPDSAEAWDYLADALDDDGPPDDERLGALRRVVELRPGDSSALNSLAWGHVQRGEGAVALPVAERAARQAPWSPAILDTWAATLAAAGRCPEAVAVQRRAVAMLPDRVPEAMRTSYTSTLAKLEAQCPASAAR